MAPAASTLDDWQVVLLVLPPGTKPPSAAWHETYHDSDGAIYERESLIHGLRLVPSVDPANPTRSVMVARQVRLDP